MTQFAHPATYLGCSIEAPSTIHNFEVLVSGEGYCLYVLARLYRFSVILVRNMGFAQ